MSSVSSYVDVYIWRGRNSKGEMTTSSESITSVRIKGNPLTGRERCGHAAMCVFLQQPPNRYNLKNEQHYISLWPGENGMGYLQPDLESDIKSEGGKPDVIVRLHHLDIQQMINAFNNVAEKVNNGEVVWTLYSSDNENLLCGSTAASCTSFVQFFLKVGGIEKPKYSECLSLKGPQDTDFYKLAKCHIGRRLWGLGDGWFWTRALFTPYALSLRVASAAEAYPNDDLKVTKQIMHDPNRVDTVVDKKNSSTGTVAASVASAVPDASTVYLFGNLAALSIGAFCVYTLSRWVFGSSAHAGASGK